MKELIVTSLSECWQNGVIEKKKNHWLWNWTNLWSNPDSNPPQV